MGINDELAKLVAGIPHSHPCAYCDLDYRCQDSRCWGKRSFMCHACTEWKYADAESYRVGSEAGEDEPRQQDEPGDKPDYQEA